MKPPKFVPIETLPDSAQRALIELIAHTLTEQADTVHYKVQNATYDGQPLGEYEIIIQRL